MRQTLIILTCMVAIGLYAPNASALRLTFDDSLSVGWFNPCASGVATAEVACIDSLMTLPPIGSNTIAGIAYNPVGSTVAGPLYPPTSTDPDTDDSAGNVSGFMHLLGLDGPTSLGLTGSMTVPTNLGLGDEGTNDSRFGTGTAAAPDPVPDGGTTAALLGLALVAIRLVNRASLTEPSEIARNERAER